MYEDQFYNENLRFLHSVGKVNNNIPFVEYLAPLFPLDFYPAGDKTWNRRVDFLNRQYFTKMEASKISIITWNVASNIPPVNPDECEFIFDAKEPIICISLEEVEMSVQSAMIGNSPHLEDWHNVFIKAGLKNGYRSIHHSMLGSVYVEIFIKNDLHHKSEIIGIETIRFGGAGTLANKSAIFVTMKVAETTISYCGCHLIPHRENLQVRNEQLQTIISKLNEIDSDYKFISGDLNYRLQLDYDDCINICLENGISKLLPHDELLQEKFPIIEGEIAFLPTYRFDKNSQIYDTSKKQRVPSYCDRIIAVKNENLKFETESNNMIFETDIIRDTKIGEFAGESYFGVSTGEPNYPISPKPIQYRSFKNVTISDHRPVNAVFEFTLCVIDEERKSLYLKIKNKRRDELSMLSIPHLTVDKRSFVLKSDDQIELMNNSCATAEWNIDKLDTLDISPLKGTLPPGEKQVLKISPINLKDFELVTININEGNPLFLEILEKDQNHKV
ncbi:Endonuclease/Exonuclease/phosphatase family protein [Trichomonas vaginalis G3]|uniref:Endonuclease/Exonuclease/phosphatase family protein n=1 Tax=Trichomonas vaginalis (strain ATCC PRA-98 / G3) TaxID=412133 RepID=A2G7C6_TRIV3|nr:phosphatidylinositol dephosphorylation [Trichomonas vaginalis G3]EAX86941.1 Endonuclease/Exonuclease/phosphatase family protein [Trichomonas vaginalis G3]KAI5539108.1 phosphatidylinositol dephosphorylation [Trichomonas vaginalis G3]|eukprot:XP_001299871.1 Endonuclease/Exonuclease/phosphatase family protein [Trichomonas vaginalis G3]